MGQAKNGRGRMGLTKFHKNGCPSVCPRGGARGEDVDEGRHEHRQALGILLGPKKYCLGSGTLPWLRRRFGRFSRFDDPQSNAVRPISD